MTLRIELRGLDTAVVLPLPNTASDVAQLMLVAQLLEHIPAIDELAEEALADYIARRGESVTLEGARTRARRLLHLYVAATWRELLRECAAEAAPSKSPSIEGLSRPAQVH